MGSIYAICSRQCPNGDGIYTLLYALYKYSTSITNQPTNTLRAGFADMRERMDPHFTPKPNYYKCWIECGRGRSCKCLKFFHYGNGSHGQSVSLRTDMVEVHVKTKQKKTISSNA